MVRFTDRELDVMTVLWDRGPSTVSEVQEALVDDLAYTTVLTVLRVLEDKGHVTHTPEGRAHRYEPLVERGAAGSSALRRLTRNLFSGSPELLLTRLVEDDDLSRDELRRMRDLLAERLGEEGEGGKGADAGGEGVGDGGGGRGDGEGAS
jgi:predicted transcriptional regulator